MEKIFTFIFDKIWSEIRVHIVQKSIALIFGSPRRG